MSRIKGVGPGFVYVLTILGTGDLITNSAAGAGYGYALIWALGLTLVFRYVWVNTSAKYVLVTGESLMQGYARLG
ncbi:MAG: Mn2+/Fe2+ transporter, partial [Acidobacteriota bacterium]